MTHTDVVTTSVWDDPRNVDMLKEMWSEGKSAQAIADALSVGQPEPVTRSAVLGKADRLKLPKKGRTHPVKEQPPKSAHPVAITGKKGRTGNPGVPSAQAIVRRAKSRGAQGMAFKLAEARKQGLNTREAMPLVLGRQPFREGSLPPEDDAGVDVSHLCGIMELGSTSVLSRCRWIHGEPTADAKFCGKPTKDGSAYCPDHHARVYSGMPGQHD